ncbi:MAG: ATP-binding protein [Bacteroidota bacterium]
MILQPFIENAVWHGVLPKNGGNVTVSVARNAGTIECRIDDNGIGRERAMRNKSQTSNTYESKGMKLVKNRLNLYNTIHRQGGSIDVTDKKDKDNNPAGTLVIVKFKQDA